MNTIDALLQELAHARTYARSKEVQQFALDLAGKYEGPLLSMCSKEGPSDEPVAWMTEDGRLASIRAKSLMPSAAEEAFCIPLYRHPAPKVGALLEAAEDFATLPMKYGYDHPLEWDAKRTLLLRLARAAKADASLQGEGSSSSSLGDAVQSDGPGDPAVGCPSSHDLTHGQATSPPPPIAEHPQGQPTENPDAR